MFFIGIIWATSWYSGLVIANQILLSSVTTNVYETKVSSQFNYLTTNLLSYVAAPKPKPLLWSATILPSRFLDIDWGNEKSSSKQPVKGNKTSVKSVNQDSKTVQNFCSVFDRTTFTQPILDKQTIPSRSPQTLKASIEGQTFFSNFFLQSLENFFRFTNLGRYSQKYLKPAALPPVVIVRRGDDSHEIWVKNRLIASLSSKSQANLLRQRLKKMLKTPDLDIKQLRPAFVDGVPSIMLGNRVLFGINKEASVKVSRSNTLLAIKWINNLRSALEAPPISLVEGQKQIYALKTSNKKLSGLASWYGDYFHGRLTANGERYNQYALSVAHKSLPFNTFLHVTNTKNGKSVIVRVNDRGPYIPPRSLDLSRAAARCIGSETDGVVPYKAVIMKPDQIDFTLNSSDISLESRNSKRGVKVVAEF
ncbi:MAG: septal ring lytic transglycosylase RlpA family protein [Cyanobacteria bacterium P01_A01_bin.84]